MDSEFEGLCQQLTTSTGKDGIQTIIAIFKLAKKSKVGSILMDKDEYPLFEKSIIAWATKNEGANLMSLYPYDFQSITRSSRMYAAHIDEKRNLPLLVIEAELMRLALSENATIDNQMKLFLFYQAVYGVFLTDRERQSIDPIPEEKQSLHHAYEGKLISLSAEILKTKDLSPQLKEKIMTELSLPEHSQSKSPTNRLQVQSILYNEALKDKNMLKNKMKELFENHQNVFALAHLANHKTFMSDKLPFYTHILVSTANSSTADEKIIKTVIEDVKKSTDDLAKWTVRFCDYLKEHPDLMEKMTADKIGIHHVILAAMDMDEFKFDASHNTVKLQEAYAKKIGALLNKDFRELTLEAGDNKDKITAHLKPAEKKLEAAGRLGLLAAPPKERKEDYPNTKRNHL